MMFVCLVIVFAALVGFIWIIVYVVLMLVLYISPLAIRSPCIVEMADLPQKPRLLAHKGASAVCHIFIVSFTSQFFV